MSSSMGSSRQWIVAASMATVEALKDQGFCRWNYALRSIHHHAKNNVSKSLSQAKKNMSSSSTVESSSMAVLSNGKLIREAESVRKAKQAEESLRKVMYLSCWGPN